MLEYLGEQTNPGKIGEIEVNTEYAARRKPFWLVLLKLVCLLAMFAVGLALLLPSIPLPWWQAVALAAGLLLIYVGLAFFFRPEPNTDNMGWCGGLMNDPFRYSDNVNRWLWSLHCFLGPGRFVAETMLDACTLVGLRVEGDEDAADEQGGISNLNSEISEI